MSKVINVHLLFVLVLCASTIYPASSLTRWFSYSYTDLKETIRRFSHCVSGLDYGHHDRRDFADLGEKVRYFLDQGSYDNEQLANITLLMEGICRPAFDSSYPISVHINVSKYSVKENRCASIDTSMDALYTVFKRSAYNKSEPLDFSAVQFYPNPKDKSASYNLTDLINTSWIESGFLLENVCKLTDSVRDYVSQRVRNSTAQDRSQQQPSTSMLGSLMDMIDRLLEPLLGLQRRFVWVGSNSLEQLSNGVSHQVGSFASSVGRGFRSAGARIGFGRSAQTHPAANSTATNRMVTNDTLVSLNMTTVSAASTTTSQP